jgi:hypothetical protein
MLFGSGFVCTGQNFTSFVQAIVVAIIFPYSFALTSGLGLGAVTMAILAQRA